MHPNLIRTARRHSAARQSRLDTTPNSAAARETDMLISSTRDLTAHNKDKIKQLNKLAKDKAQKQQVQAIKSRFMSLLNEYQVVEKEFRKKVRERGERQFRIGVLPGGLSAVTERETRADHGFGPAQ
jgi:syntaxin 1B/2/3